LPGYLSYNSIPLQEVMEAVTDSMWVLLLVVSSRLIGKFPMGLTFASWQIELYGLGLMPKFPVHILV